MRNISQYRFQNFVDSKINENNNYTIGDADLLKGSIKEKKKRYLMKLKLDSKNL